MTENLSKFVSGGHGLFSLILAALLRETTDLENDA